MLEVHIFIHSFCGRLALAISPKHIASGCFVRCRLSLGWYWVKGQFYKWGLRSDFKPGMGLLFIQFDMHCFCGSVAQTAVVCCVVSFVALVAYNHPGVALSPERGWF